MLAAESVLPVRSTRSAILRSTTSGSGRCASSISCRRRYACKDRPVAAARALSSSHASPGTSRIVIDRVIASICCHSQHTASAKTTRGYFARRGLVVRARQIGLPSCHGRLHPDLDRFDHPRVRRAPSALRRAVPGGARRVSGRRHPRGAPPPAVPGLHDPWPRRLEVGCRRPRVRRLRDGARRAAARPQPPGGGGRGHRPAPARHPARRQHRAGDRLGARGPGPDAVGRADSLPQLRHRGVDDGDPHGARLHRARPDRHLRRSLPRLARLRGGRLRPLPGHRHPGCDPLHGHGAAGRRSGRGRRHAGIRRRRRGDAGAHRRRHGLLRRAPGLPGPTAGDHHAAGRAPHLRRGRHRLPRLQGRRAGALRRPARPDHAGQDPGRRPAGRRGRRPQGSAEHPVVPARRRPAPAHRPPGHLQRQPLERRGRHALPAAPHRRRRERRRRAGRAPPAARHRGRDRRHRRDLFLPPARLDGLDRLRRHPRRRSRAVHGAAGNGRRGTRAALRRAVQAGAAQPRRRRARRRVHRQRRAHRRADRPHRRGGGGCPAGG